MTRDKKKNIASSIHARLLNKARNENRPFSEILQYYTMERFLYRLSMSSYCDKLVLKGALMLQVWKAAILRPTRDIDFLGRMSNKIEPITDAIREICLKEVEPDGLFFDVDSITGERISEDADYEGVRIKFYGNLEASRINMQIDIGFGDIVVPKPVKISFPVILDLPAPSLYGYSMESSIAEKYEAMVILGMINSRMKDFFDIWILSRLFMLDGETLLKAMKATFSNRGITTDKLQTNLMEQYANNPLKSTQWEGFIKKNKLTNVSQDFRQVIEEIKIFIEPISKSLADNIPFKKTWLPCGPWK